MGFPLYSKIHGNPIVIHIGFQFYAETCYIAHKSCDNRIPIVKKNKEIQLNIFWFNK